MPLNICISGALGRMGQTVAAAAGKAGHHLSGRLEKGEDVAAALRGADVVIDFSFPDATTALAAHCVAVGLPLVIGTTGHSPAQREAVLAEIRGRLPVVWTGNFSVGVNLLYYLTELAARRLGPAWDVEILEAHHRHKADAPSGTARGLLAAVQDGWGQAAPGGVVYGREGISGERPAGQVAFHALRAGEIVGEHTVYFAGSSERLELTHRASDRAIFAEGALRAAAWLVGRSPGLYSMRDVLGLPPAP